jgi:hypothetical protein
VLDLLAIIDLGMNWLNYSMIAKGLRELEQQQSTETTRESTETTAY